MAAPVTRVQPTKLPTLPAPSTPEQKYWRSFKSPLLIHEYGSITAINFSPVAPHDFAVTSSSLVKIFSSKTRVVAKTLPRIKDVPYSGHFRSDGRLMVAGDASGRMQVFDMSSRAVVRTWDEHKQAVHTARFSPASATSILSTSDDATVRLWDLPSETSTHTFVDHEDYVRTGTFLPGSAASLLASGGYDGTVRLWDPRAGKTSVMTLRHHSPIDALLAMPGATTLLAASGPIIHVWDIVAAKEFTTLKNHQKTVTTLALASGGSAGAGSRRVLSGSLDGHVKVYDPTVWKVVHGIKYPHPILSVAVAPDEKHLAVGMVSGLLSVRTRTSGKDKHRLKDKERALDLIAAGIDPITDKGGAKKKSSARLRQLKGIEYRGEGADIVVEKLAGKTKALPLWEKHLRKGRYRDALDLVLSDSKDQLTVFTCLNELRYRNALGTAISGRDEDSLKPLVDWAAKFVKEPRMVEVVVEVSLRTLDLYSHALGQSPGFDQIIDKLRERVAKEVENAQQACKTKGMLGMLLAGVE